MKVLYITRKYPPSIGGMQTQSVEFYENLSKQHKVFLIKWGYSQIYLALFYIYAFINAVVILITQKIDVIQTGDLVLSPLGLMFKWLFRKPVLSVSHGRDCVYHSFIYDKLIIGSAKRLDKIVCVSSSNMAKLLERGFLKQQLKVIPNGINVENIDRSNFGREYSLQVLETKFGIRLKNRKIILSLSRLIPKKGINEFISQVFPGLKENNPEVCLLIGGDGPEKEKILKTITRLDLNKDVCLLGNLAHGSEIYNALFNTGLVFIMPNISVKDDAEGFGLVVLESSLNSLPVVAYDVDGINEALHNNKNGILVKAGDYTEFVKKVDLFLNDPDFRKSFVSQAKKYTIDNFNWNRIINLYGEEYNALIGDH